METGRVTERDKDYMRRLARFEEEGNAEWLAFWRSLSLDERLRRSFQMTQEALPDDRREPEDPGQIYERAKRLGLYHG